MTQETQEGDLAEEIKSGNFEIRKGQWGDYLAIRNAKGRKITLTKYGHYGTNIGTREEPFWVNFKELTKEAIQNGLNYALNKLEK